MAGFSCRHCGRTVAVLGSRCPWCHKRIAVICANCKAYTGDESIHCEHCHAPLQADNMKDVVRSVRHPVVARIAEDQDRAKLVASGIVFAHLDQFFYDDGCGRRTVLAALLGSERRRISDAVALFFAAYVYLFQEGYSSLEAIEGEDGLRVVRLDMLRSWDGQRSLEEAVAERAARAISTREATDGAIREMMGFRVRNVPTGGARSLLRSSYGPLDLSDRSVFSAIDQKVRLTVLPEHDINVACRTTHQLLADFVAAEPELARTLVEETLSVLQWFESYEGDPSMGLPPKSKRKG